MRKIINFLVGIYQDYISPLLGPHCRFRPTCSEYCRQAINNHGIFRGILLAIWRIIRCNPFSRGGWDPVPKK